VRAGEAETGSGGDQPDQGIAGRNSSGRWARACSSRRVLLPGLRGRPAGGGRLPPQGSAAGEPHRT